MTPPDGSPTSSAPEETRARHAYRVSCNWSNYMMDGGDVEAVDHGGVASPRQLAANTQSFGRSDDIFPKSKGDRGIIHVETRGYKQNGTVACTIRRKVMVSKRSHGDARAGEQPGRPEPSAGPDSCSAFPNRVARSGAPNQANLQR